MIRAILACDDRGVIGVNGQIPWRYPADLAHFKRATMGGVCVMGRKTFEGIPPTKTGEVLPGRHIVVLTRDTSRLKAEPPPNACCATGLDEAIGGWAEFGLKNIWICGGAKVYQKTLRLEVVEEIWLTMVPRVATTAGDEVATINMGTLNNMYWESSDQPDGFEEAGLRFSILRKSVRI